MCEITLSCILCGLFPVLCTVVLAWVIFKTFNGHQDEKSLVGKHVLITGGSSGIGLEVAKNVVRRGAHCTIVARNKQRLEEAVKEITREKVIIN